jgi:hypothetical protein
VSTKTARFPLRQPEFTVKLGDEISNRWMLRRLLKRGLDASISSDGLCLTIYGEFSEVPSLRVAALSGVELL